jgi:hypothetical protein
MKNKTMSPEEQRIAIALACGAKWRLFDSGYTFLTFAEEESGFTDVDAPADPAKVVISETVPDYLGSLDAMHEAEKVLTSTPYSYRFGNATYSSDQRSDYYQLLMYGNQPSFLEDGCGKHADMPKGPDRLPHLRGGIYATAPQRAEAFLRTLGLWTEGGESDPLTGLLEILREGKVQVRLGIGHHVPKIDQMLAEGSDWDAVALEVGWHKETAIKFYEQWKESNPSP